MALEEVGMALHGLCLNLSNPAPVGARRLAALDRWLPCTVSTRVKAMKVVLRGITLGHQPRIVLNNN